MSKGLNQLSKEFHKFQIQFGFTDPDVVKRFMLIGSELFEAFEAFREDKYADIDKYNRAIESNNEIIKKTKTKIPKYESFKQAFEDHIKDTLEDELADIIIQVLAFCGEHGIDIESHVALKSEYNCLRGYKYGGKKF